MALDIKRAFDVTAEGIALKGDSCEVKLYIASGAGSPVGQDAPVPTVYVNETNADIWKKTGPNNTDWVLLDAGDKNFSIFKALSLVTIPENQQMLVCDQICVEGSGEYCLEENAEIIII